MGTIGDMRRLTAEDLHERIEGPLEEMVALPAGQVPVLYPEALYGVLGRVAVTIHEYTGLDVVALYLTLLTVIGNLIGWQVFTQLDDGPRQYTQGGVIIVGPSGDGKDRVVRAVLDYVADKLDDTWRSHNVIENPQSPQVLVSLVRDPTTKTTIDKKTGQPNTIDIPGVDDTRILILEREFSRLLKLMDRPGNEMSERVRETFDGTRLQSTAKTGDLNELSTRCHMSWIGLITPNAFAKYVIEDYVTDGLLNRFVLTLLVRGAPTKHGGLEQALATDIEEIQDALDAIQGVPGRFGLVPLASDVAEGLRKLHQGAWQHLQTSRGLAGTMEARYMPHVCGHAMIFALMDQSHRIEWRHFHAATHLRWNGAETNHILLAGRTGSADADEVRALLKRNHPEATAKTDIWNEFGHSVKLERINAALRVLEQQGHAKGYKGESTQGKNGRSGRKPELWKLTPKGLEAGELLSLISQIPKGLRSLVMPDPVPYVTRIGDTTDSFGPEDVGITKSQRYVKKVGNKGKKSAPSEPGKNGDQPRRRMVLNKSHIPLNSPGRTLWDEN